MHKRNTNIYTSLSKYVLYNISCHLNSVDPNFKGMYINKREGEAHVRKKKLTRGETNECVEARAGLNNR